MNSQHPYQAEFTVHGNGKVMKNTYRSIKPEMEETDRTKVDLTLSENSLGLTITAADSVALRAAVNSHLRWISEVMEICERTLG